MRRKLQSRYPRRSIYCILFAYGVVTLATMYLSTFKLLWNRDVAITQEDFAGSPGQLIANQETKIADLFSKSSEQEDMIAEMNTKIEALAAMLESEKKDVKGSLRQPKFTQSTQGATSKTFFQRDFLANDVGTPTLERPFVFFHIPKCGGSTLRSAIYKATKSIGLHAFAPCYDSVPCSITELDLVGKTPEIDQKAACAEVFAGHFTTLLVPTLGRISGNRKNDGDQCTRKWPVEVVDSPETPYFDCLIAVRNPISRFVSHYYHFIEKDNPAYHGRKLKDMSLGELTKIIHDSANNTMLDYLSKHLSYDKHFGGPKDGHVSYSTLDKINVANHVMKQCIIVVMEDWEASASLAESAVPWLKGHLSNQKALNVKANRREHESITDFAPDIAEALLGMFEGDTAVYNQALEIHREQLKNFGIEFKDKKEENNSKIQVAKLKEASPSFDPVTPAFQDAPFVKAVTYFGRGNPLNFWDQRFEVFIDSDFRSFREKGFNTLILLVPWAGVQLTIVPPTYKSFILERIEFVLGKAVEHGLYTIFRISYPHSYDPMNKPAGHERCRLFMGVGPSSNEIKNGWLDYVSSIGAIFTKEEYKESYLHSFTSWEDFFCLIAFSQTNRNQKQERLKLSKEIGFDKYVLEHYKPDEIRNMFMAEDIESGEYPIPIWDVGDKAFSTYIKFIDSKWWETVELGRTVHPHLTMELRVDKEGGKVQYDLHPGDRRLPKQIYWGGYMGSKPGVPLHAATAVTNLERMMVHSTVNATSSVILGQFNFQDNTPHLVMRSIVLEECNTFLEKAALILKKYTRGYGLWAYRNYRQSEIFNGSFLLGLEGWSSKKTGEGSIGVDQEGFLQLSSFCEQCSVTIEQAVKQLPENNCDNGNNKMEVCFRYRRKGNGEQGLHVVWNGKKVDELIEFSGSWKEKCIRVPPLVAHKFYPIGFRVQGQTSVNIDNVEVSCHTHSMYMNDVNNDPISICGDGMHKLNELL